MKADTIPSSWFAEAGNRLDAAPYVASAFRVRLLLRRLQCRKDLLRDVCAGPEGGIFNGPKFRRVYVSSSQYGVPFMGSTTMLHADLSDLPLLRRTDAESNRLRHLELVPGSILISCSGTVGKMAFVREDMRGIWSSQHIMKVCPNRAVILPGYLYAYLCGHYGQALVAGGTYGAIVQHIEPEHLHDIIVPRFSPQVESEADTLVSQAAALRTKAIGAIAAATQALLRELGLRDLKATDVAAFSTTSVLRSELEHRLDAPYHSAAAHEAEAALDALKCDVKTIPEVVARYFKPSIFKRLWVDGPEHGTRFVSGIDAYRFHPEEDRFVSWRTPNHDSFVARRGWVIFQAAGQIYGLFGKPIYVSGWLEGVFCADDLYRLVPSNESDGAYLYLFLRTPHGQSLIKRQACGDSIPRIWDPHVRHVRVPWPDRDVRNRLAEPVMVAHDELETARDLEERAVRLVEASIEEAIAWQK